jgi:hypothetical protein
MTVMAIVPEIASGPRVARSDPHRLAVADDLRTQLLELDELGLYVEDAYAEAVNASPSLDPELSEMLEAYWQWTDTLKHRLVAIGVRPWDQVVAMARDLVQEPRPSGPLTAPGTISALTDSVAGAVSRAHSRAARLAELDPLSRDVQADIAEGLEKHLWRLRAQEALTRAMLVAGEVWPHSAEEPAPSGESRTHRRAVQEGPSPSGPAGHPDVRDGG